MSGSPYESQNRLVFTINVLMHTCNAWLWLDVLALKATQLLL
jgi:hypothetical protein